MINQYNGFSSDQPNLDKSKIINDCVHGHMRFHPLLVKIIDTPQFQRLRRIKQLGSSYMVYPGASHNRFEHSLGTCYLAGVMMDRLMENMSPVTSTSVRIEKKHKLWVQVAALCHDLGHGPFSHTWETFVNESANYRGKKNKWTHEDASLDMLDDILESMDKEDKDLLDVKLIKTMISGVAVKDSGTFKDKRLLYLTEIVSNKFCDIDVDKWDYLLRDSKQVNIPTGFDYNRLLGGVRVIELDGETHISYRDSDAINVTRMYMDRANLHYYCYKHKVSLLTEAMIIDVLKLSDESSSTYVKGLPMSQAHTNMKAYVQLTDSILEKIQWASNDRSSANEIKASELVNRIVTRDLYVLIYKQELERIDDMLAIEERKHEITDSLFGITSKEIKLGNTGRNGHNLLNNTLYHDKHGDLVELGTPSNMQIFRTEGTFWRGEILIFCKLKQAEISKEFKEMATVAAKEVIEEIINQSRTTKR